MRRACSRQRIHSGDEFVAAVTVSDSESDSETTFASDISGFSNTRQEIDTDEKWYPYENTKVIDDGYFFGPTNSDYVTTSTIDLSKYEKAITTNLGPVSKKRDREPVNISKVQTAASMRKSFSCFSLQSENNYFQIDLHTIPAKPSELSRTSSLTKIHTKASKSSLDYSIASFPQKTKKGNDRIQKKALKTMRRKGRHNQVSTIRPLPFFKNNITTSSASVMVTDANKKEGCVTFSTLPDDVMILVMASLTPSELRALMSTSVKNFSLCRTEHLWMNFCEKEWKIMNILKQQQQETNKDTKSFFNSCTKIKLCDDLTIPNTAKRISIRPCISHVNTKVNPAMNNDDNTFVLNDTDFCPKNTNLSVLLELTQPYPVKVDDDFFSSKLKHENTVNALASNIEQDQESSPVFRSFDMTTTTRSFAENRDVHAVQFTSTVGTGDRCIRSDKPFPAIHLSKYLRFPQLSLFGHFARAKGKVKSSSVSTGSISPFHDMFKRGKKFLSMSTLKPFVSPIVTKIEQIQSNGRKEVIYTMNVTPRLLAYFEITLILRDESQEPSSLSPLQSQSMYSVRNSTLRENLTEPELRLSSDCVAIGLSTGGFNPSSKMPGWDRFSYGYHGDDGGIFHAGGVMVRKYGRTFGVGDTVGCGINYANQGIFFTLNGEFLGYGWTGINLTDQLYPTVGIDTHNPIEINFGSRPFAYDTSPFSDQHLPLIDHSLRDLPIFDTKIV